MINLIKLMVTVCVFILLLAIAGILTVRMARAILKFIFG